MFNNQRRIRTPAPWRATEAQTTLIFVRHRSGVFRCCAESNSRANKRRAKWKRGRKEARTEAGSFSPEGATSCEHLGPRSQSCACQNTPPTPTSAPCWSRGRLDHPARPLEVRSGCCRDALSAETQARLLLLLLLFFFFFLDLFDFLPR